MVKTTKAQVQKVPDSPTPISYQLAEAKKDPIEAYINMFSSFQEDLLIKSENPISETETKLSEENRLQISSVLKKFRPENPAASLIKDNAKANVKKTEKNLKNQEKVGKFEQKLDQQKIQNEINQVELRLNQQGQVISDTLDKRSSQVKQKIHEKVKVMKLKAKEAEKVLQDKAEQLKYKAENKYLQLMNNLEQVTLEKSADFISKHLDPKFLMKKLYISQVEYLRGVMRWVDQLSKQLSLGSGMSKEKMLASKLFITQELRFLNQMEFLNFFEIRGSGSYKQMSVMYIMQLNCTFDF